MFTIYTDKAEDFKCKIGVEGSDISKTIARLVIEGKNISLLFDGTIDSEGNCTIPISKVKNIFNESDEGKMKLEVISDDTFFSPWDGDFVVKASKKVTIEVEEKQKEPIKETKIGINVVVPTQQSKPTISEPVKKEPTKVVVSEEINHGKMISEILSKNGVTLSNIKENKEKVNKIIKEYSIKHKVNTMSEGLLDEIINNLKF